MEIVFTNEGQGDCQDLNVLDNPLEKIPPSAPSSIFLSTNRLHLPTAPLVIYIQG